MKKNGIGRPSFTVDLDLASSFLVKLGIVLTKAVAARIVVEEKNRTSII